jgi:glycosyltransferase involved in cell wall biosynthesis
MPKVTVYIPCFNYGKYLARAMQSVFAQTLDDWELIIINDGSTDNTSQVLAKYAEHHRIRIVEQENKGLNATNNIALRLAQGRYIVRLDADDYFDENILLVMSNILDTKPEVGLVYSDYYHIDEAGNIIEAVRRKKTGDEVELLDLPAHGACTMFRRECLLEVGGYQEGIFCQDGYDIWIKTIQRYRPYNVNIPLFYYRQHSASLTRRQKRILKTRRQIKQEFVDRSGRSLSVLGIVPVAKQSVYPHAQPFYELAGKPLLWYTLHELQNAAVLDRIILASDDDEVLTYGKQFRNVETFKRPAQFGRSSLRMEALAKHVMSELKSENGYVPDAVCLLYCNTPLRRVWHIEQAVNTMLIFDPDSVISVQEELAYCYQHRRHGLAPINRKRRDIRLEREAVYKENGAIYLTKNHIIQSDRFLGKTIGHVIMLPEESVKINSAHEHWIAGKIITQWQDEKELVSTR